MFVVVVERKWNIVFISGGRGSLPSLRRYRLVVDNANNKTAFVKSHSRPKELLDQIMWHRALADVLDHHLHLRIVRETSILLLEPKMCRMEMYDERWRTVRVFLENIGCSFDCNGNKE
jgi:hypothetical protein